MPTFWKIDKPEEVPARLGFLGDYLRDNWNWNTAVEIWVKPYSDPRSHNQNALFWMWCDDLAKFFAAKSGEVFTKDGIHDVLCHKFLGYEDRVVGKIVIKDQLKTTKPLDKGEFQRLMEQIDAWACDLGCQLRYPEHSQYMKQREEQYA